MRQHHTPVTFGCAFTQPRDRRRQGRAEPDPVRETTQRVQSGVGDDLCPTAFNIGVQRAVTVHFASALPVGFV